MKRPNDSGERLRRLCPFDPYGKQAYAALLARFLAGDFPTADVALPILFDAGVTVVGLEQDLAAVRRVFSMLDIAFDAEAALRELGPIFFPREFAAGGRRRLASPGVAN